VAHRKIHARSGRCAVRMPDHRKGARRPTMLSATIVLDGEIRPRRCLLTDLSDTGVRLHVAQPELLPVRFTLLIGGQTPRQCRMIWRSHTELGAEFVDQTDVPLAPEHDPEGISAESEQP